MESLSYLIALSALVLGLMWKSEFLAVPNTTTDVNYPVSEIVSVLTD